MRWAGREGEERDELEGTIVLQLCGHCIDVAVLYI